MSRRRKDPLRPLTDDERRELTRLSRSHAEPAVRVARAAMLLAVAGGSDYQRAARTAGRESGDAVSHLVARFNREGLTALDPDVPVGRAEQGEHLGRAPADVLVRLAGRVALRPPGRAGVRDRLERAGLVFAPDLQPQ